jgi:hypothetical protein
MVAMSEQATGAGVESAPERAETEGHVLASPQLREAIAREWITAGDYRIRPDAIQPASLDLRLGECAWALRCSFLPDIETPVE